ncbi:2OG-Fe(II) oxygenase [Pseudotenacibaculum sp. MALMAid0570]|uniref:2OG-Fe(II) oxygenase n=1 Tax=Pseudotenacibaculum sp. MALMAid0570 TaxID=3143938 RepID=UPI0032DFA24F
MYIKRHDISQLLLNTLEENKQDLKDQFSKTKDEIGYFILDNVLPIELVHQIFDSFPNLDNTVKKHTLREHKHVGYQMNEFNTLLEEVIYAFQEKTVVDKIAKLCDIEHLEPDENLYAGGISLMRQDNFLNPHLDNSHDKDINRWRVLNLLYYVTPDWKLENGGNLELWPEGVKNEPITIESKFNRLVVMATHDKSWHSVSKVRSDRIRCCVSNYYFSKSPLKKTDSFHVTTFRGRPSEKLKNIVLQCDSFLRNSLRKVIKKGIRENKHQYKK